MDTTTLPPRGKLNLHYYLLQIGFWGGIGCFTGFQSVIVLDRGFTSADVGVFVAVCNLAGILFQPQLGAWADRHPEIPLKRIFLCCILTALGLNTVFLFTRPGFLLTALFFALMGMAEVNSFTLIDAMAMQYINAGADLPYSLGRGLGSLSYAVMCILVGRLTAAFTMQSALLAHGAMLVLLILATVTFPTFPRGLQPPREERKPPHSALAILRGNPPFTLMMLAGFFGMMAVMPVDNFLINLLENLGGDSGDLGLALFLKAASELPAAFLVERLYRRIGSQKVLLIGVGYEKNTSLHLADARASYPGKHTYTAHSAVIENGKRVWKAYETLYVDGEDFAAIGAAFEQEHAVQKGALGGATLRLMRQRELVDFSVKWIEENRT